MSDAESSQSLLEGIKRDTEREIASLYKEMEQDVEDKERAHKRWEKRELAHWQSKMDEALSVEKRKLDSYLRMEEKKISLLSQDKLLARIEEESMHRLEEALMKDDLFYKKQIKLWIIEGILSLQEPSVIIEGGVREQEMLSSSFLKEIRDEVFHQIGLKTELKLSSEQITHIPGVILHSEDGRISFNNQIPARFSRLKSQIRQKINQGIKGVQHG